MSGIKEVDDTEQDKDKVVDDRPGRGRGRRAKGSKIRHRLRDRQGHRARRRRARPATRPRQPCRAGLSAKTSTSTSPTENTVKHSHRPGRQRRQDGTTITLEIAKRRTAARTVTSTPPTTPTDDHDRRPGPRRPTPTARHTAYDDGPPARAGAALRRAPGRAAARRRGPSGLSPAERSTASASPHVDQPVGEHPVPALGEHALGVELHAVQRQVAVPDGHDDPGLGVAVGDRARPGTVAGSMVSEW